MFRGLVRFTSVVAIACFATLLVLICQPWPLAGWQITLAVASMLLGELAGLLAGMFFFQFNEGSAQRTVLLEDVKRLLASATSAAVAAFLASTVAPPWGWMTGGLVVWVVVFKVTPRKI
jgi:hypothetical protein